jgi:hypothetical protein
MAHQSRRAENMAVLAQSAERQDSPLQLQPVRVDANVHA